MIQFKTRTPYFEKERDNLKCNTIRELGDSDSRFDDLMEMIQSKSYGNIKIINPMTMEEFEREITDVTYYQGWFIISWRNK